MPDEMVDPFGSMPRSEQAEERVANPVAVDNAEDKVERRATVESEYSGRLHAREMKYLADRNELESEFHGDVADLRKERELALTEAGLNPDGSDPQGRQQGLATLA